MGKTWLKWLYNFKLTFIKKSLGPNFLAANLRILMITCDSLCPHDDWTSRGHHVPTGCHRTEEDFFSSCVSFYKWGEPFPEAPSSLPTSWNQIACLSKPADGKRKNTTTGLWPIRIQPGGAREEVSSPSIWLCHEDCASKEGLGVGILPGWLHWGKGHNQDFQAFLDTGPELTLIARDPTCHCDPPVRVGLMEVR